jgi:NhaA family Na+:H+ antiporter
MSIFITNLAFPAQPDIVNAAKIAILSASLFSGIMGFAWLKLKGGLVETDTDPDTMDY